MAFTTYAHGTAQLFQLGANFAGLVNVENLSATPSLPPTPRFYPYTETVRNGAGGNFGRGAALLVWTFGFAPNDLMTNLLDICPSASASVMIRSRKENGGPVTVADYKYYNCTMNMPDPSTYEWRGRSDGHNGYFPLEVSFTNLVEYTPST